MSKTNALRLLDKENIEYEVREYSVDDSHSGAEDAAKKIGIPSAQLFKTLVARGDRKGVTIACVPSDAVLDLKALAKASGNKKAEMVPLKDVFPLTGYVKGGVSPIGMKGNFPVYIDQSALQFSKISVSAGMRGMQVLLNPMQLQEVVKASFAALAREKE